MRNKTVQPKTIEKYLNFLNQVKLNAKTSNITIGEIVKFNAISKTVPKALITLKIIKQDGKATWDWLRNDPDKPMVLEILDYLLHSRKAQEAALLPEQVTIITLLRKIISNQERSLKEAKNEVIALQSDYDKEIRFKAAFAIAGGIYGSHPNLNENGFYDYDSLNEYVIKATDDLLKKLNDEHRWKK